MIILVDALLSITKENIHGYIDTGKLDNLEIEGFLNYLIDHGYTNISMYAPSNSVIIGNTEQITMTLIDTKKLKSLQKEFVSAIRSIEYYPRNDLNDYMRSVYAKSSILNSHFKVPE